MPDLWLRLSFISFELLIFSKLGKLELEVNGINYLSVCMGIHGVFARRDGVLDCVLGRVRVELGQ